MRRGGCLELPHSGSPRRRQIHISSVIKANARRRGPPSGDPVCSAGRQSPRPNAPPLKAEGENAAQPPRELTGEVSIWGGSLLPEDFGLHAMRASRPLQSRGDVNEPLPRPPWGGGRRPLRVEDSESATPAFPSNVFALAGGAKRGAGRRRSSRPLRC